MSACLVRHWNNICCMSEHFFNSRRVDSTSKYVVGSLPNNYEISTAVGKSEVLRLQFTISNEVFMHLIFVGFQNLNDCLIIGTNFMSYNQIITEFYINQIQPSSCTSDEIVMLPTVVKLKMKIHFYYFLRVSF